MVTGAGDTTVLAQNGIQISGGATGSIIDNTVSDVAHTAAGYAATAILGSGAGGTLTISGNVVSNSQIGIDVDTAANITDNTITGQGLYDWGIIASGPATITGNTVADNFVAIYTTGTATVSSNTVTGFDGINDYGIYAVGSSTITQNNVSGANVAVYLEPAGGSTFDVRDNTLSGSDAVDDVGLYVYGSPANATMDLGTTSFSGNFGRYICLDDGSTLNIDATSASFDGKTGAAMSLPELYSTEDKITHGVDQSGLGFVRVKAGNVYVTELSGSIQRGIDVASPGDTINVEGPATAYAGGIVVDKDDLTLLGSGMPTVGAGDFGDGYSGAFEVKAANVVIDGFNLSDGTLAGKGVLLLPGYNGATIENNVIAGFARGISITDDADASSGNTIQRNTISGAGNVGVYLQQGHDNAVTQNDIYGNAWADITVDGETGDTVANNFIDGSHYGIEVYNVIGTGANGLAITANHISGNTAVVSGGPGAGLYVDASSTGTVNASGNWWGDANGPTTGLNTYAYGPMTTGDAVVGNVTVAPWYNSGADADSDPTNGFQPAGTLDTTAPSVTLSSTIVTDTGVSSTDRITSDTTPTFTGTAEPGATVALISGSTVLGQTTADSLGNWTVTSPALLDGTYDVVARATDQAGNTATTTPPLSVTIDTSPPAVSTPYLIAADDSGSSHSDDITNVTTPTFTGTAEAGTTVRIYDTFASVRTLLGTAALTGGDWTFTVSDAFGDGVHYLAAEATDVAGNVAESAPLAVTIDTVAPTLTATIDKLAASTGWYNIDTGAPTVTYTASDPGGSAG